MSALDGALVSPAMQLFALPAQPRIALLQHAREAYRDQSVHGSIP